MKVLLNVTVVNLENKINRQIKIDDKILITDLCEYIISSLEGTYYKDYRLIKYDEKYMYFIDEPYAMGNENFKSLKLKEHDYLEIRYGNKTDYCFKVEVVSFMKKESNVDFEVLSGVGFGILDEYPADILFMERQSRLSKYMIEYLAKNFNCKENNEKVKNYKEHKIEQAKPRNYTFNVTLKGFEKEIKRKIRVNNNININSFCEKVIISMNGDLSHDFCIKQKERYISEVYYDEELYNLNLCEKNKLKLIYDWGDNWTFNLTLIKIVDGYVNNDFEVLSGSGYGIVDDCGGIFFLDDILSGKDTSWGNFKMDDFDLEKCNEKVRNEI